MATIALINGVVIESNLDNNIDTDKDNLTDWQEVNVDELIVLSNGNYMLPQVTLKSLFETLKRYDNYEYIFITGNTLPIYYLPILSDPTEEDSDGDSLLDDLEYYIGTNALKNDSDGDGLSDGFEVELWYDPLNPNSDGDSYNDKEEYDNGTSPYVYNMTELEKSEAFIRGGILGDFDTADSIEALCGQIAFSFVPFVADGRDYIANVFVNLETKAGLINLGGFLLDLAPFVGSAADAAKAFPKLSRFIAKYADDAPKVVEAIVQAAKEFPHSDEVLVGVAKILPAGAIDDVCDSIKNGSKLTKSEYNKLIEVCEAAGKHLDDTVEGSGLVLKGTNYTNQYAKKLQDTYKLFKDNGFNIGEHALNRLFGRINQGKIKSIDEVIDVLKTGTKYTDTVEGGTVIFKNGISVHFTDDGFIKTIAGQAHVKSTWEMVN